MGYSIIGKKERDEVKMGILKFIGRDSGFGKNNNSAYVECGKKLIIIDCGYTVFEKARNKFNFDKYEEIDVIITHLHNDHIPRCIWFLPIYK